MCLTSGTQQNEEINDEVNVQPHAMKGTLHVIPCVYVVYIKGETDATQDSELLSTSTESLEKEQIFQCILL